VDIDEGWNFVHDCCHISVFSSRESSAFSSHTISDDFPRVRQEIDHINSIIVDHSEKRARFDNSDGRWKDESFDRISHMSLVCRQFHRSFSSIGVDPHPHDCIICSSERISDTGERSVLHLLQLQFYKALVETRNREVLTSFDGTRIVCNLTDVIGEESSHGNCVREGTTRIDIYCVSIIVILFPLSRSLLLTMRMTMAVLVMMMMGVTSMMVITVLIRLVSLLIFVSVAVSPSSFIVVLLNFSTIYLLQFLTRSLLLLFRL
ncbi:hypothetical protein PFISCL1PPCAC_24073, partial [Pristionchus fissidentatus]